METKTARTPRRTHDGRYHHGRLKEAMVEATVALVQAHGVEQVSVREAARRAGVSSGAPFRHFPSRAALLTAAAEEAMRRFRAEVETAMAGVAGEDAIVRLRAMGLAYIRWAIANPTLFEILGNRRTLDLTGSPALRADIAELSSLVVNLLTEAGAAGLLRSSDTFNAALNARTLAYGMAHMYVDGQLAEWGIDATSAETAMTAALDHYLAGVVADPARRQLSG